jgi:hypothetical protein
VALGGAFRFSHFRNTYKKLRSRGASGFSPTPLTLDQIVNIIATVTGFRRADALDQASVGPTPERASMHAQFLAGNLG